MFAYSFRAASTAVRMWFSRPFRSVREEANSRMLSDALCTAVSRPSRPDSLASGPAVYYPGGTCLLVVNRMFAAARGAAKFRARGDIRKKKKHREIQTRQQKGTRPRGFLGSALNVCTESPARAKGKVRQATNASTIDRFIRGDCEILRVVMLAAKSARSAHAPPSAQ